MINTLQQAIEIYQQRNSIEFAPKAVLFDMDGVLYNSMIYHTKAWGETMRAEGVDCSDDEFYEHEGRTGFSTINIYYNRAFNRDATPEEIKRIYAKKSDKFTTYPQANPMPYAANLLNYLKGKGYKIVLVTGSGQKTLFDRLDNDYPNIFTPQTMVTAYNVEHGKPHPEPFLKGMEFASSAPTETIVIENAPLGVESASKAGAFTIAINTGPINKDTLYQSGADIVLPSMEVLYQQLKQVI